jgi:flagellar motility protein MotE (MotC chaperone)
MTPVKWVAQQFIRKGAALGNYLWLDSQDIGGIDKTPLRQCDNWLMGRMKEAHEVGRILKQLLGAKIPAEEIQTLALGHFYAAIGNDLKKVYVLPAGVPEPVGMEVATGKRSPESVREEFLKVKVIEGDGIYRQKCEDLEKERDQLLQTNKGMEEKLKALLTQAEPINKLEEENLALHQQLDQDKGIIDRLQADAGQLQKIRKSFAGLLQHNNTTSIPGDPSEVKMHIGHSQLVVSAKFLGERHLEFSTNNKEGQMMYCIVNELPKEGFTEIELLRKVAEHGWKILQTTANITLRKWANEGLLIRNDKNYRLPAKVVFKAVDQNG